MIEELFPYYEKELDFLKRSAALFAERYPAVAGRLALGPGETDDPHVSRLIQGVAFLNARIRAKLDDEFPELTTAILEHLFPNYLAPTPSMSIVQYRVTDDLLKPVRIDRGDEIVTEALKSGARCRFRTTADVEVWALKVESASMSGLPLVGPLAPERAVSALRLSIRCAGRNAKMAQLSPERLRIFLSGSVSQVNKLYRLLLNDTVAVAITEGGHDPNPTRLRPGAISAVGFDRKDALFPQSSAAGAGYQVMSDYFAFPEKFQFFDVSGLREKTSNTAGDRFELFFYFSESAPDLHSSVNVESFSLGCTPAVNLFSDTAEPISLRRRASEYRVSPSVRDPAERELWSVDRVAAVTRGGKTVQLARGLGVGHDRAENNRDWFWHLSRRRSDRAPFQSAAWLSFGDSNGAGELPEDWVVGVEATWTNGDLPSRMPFGGGRPELMMQKSRSGIAGLRFLIRPKPSVASPDRRQAHWRLISHLLLNHLSLGGEDGDAEPLQEMLRLYNFRNASEGTALIDSIKRVTARPGVARSPDHSLGVLCRGLDIEVTFDEELARGLNVFLLASVLENFFAEYTTINTFTRLTAKMDGRAQGFRTWNARAGHRMLI